MKQLLPRMIKLWRSDKIKGKEVKLLGVRNYGGMTKKYTGKVKEDKGYCIGCFVYIHFSIASQPPVTRMFFPS